MGGKEEGVMVKDTRITLRRATDLYFACISNIIVILAIVISKLNGVVMK